MTESHASLKIFPLAKWCSDPEVNHNLGTHVDDRPVVRPRPSSERGNDACFFSIRIPVSPNSGSFYTAQSLPLAGFLWVLATGVTVVLSSCHRGLDFGFERTPLMRADLDL